MDNAYKFADKWTFEKVANQQTLGNAGGSAGSRTPDHLIKSQMLYQLSYRPNATISVTYGDFASSNLTDINGNKYIYGRFTDTRRIQIYYFLTGLSTLFFLCPEEDLLLEFLHSQTPSTIFPILAEQTA